MLTRGYRVAILHTGRHETDEIPAEVEHIHTDPFDAQALNEALADRTFDLTIAMYGRLRRICQTMVGKTARFLSVGGGPAYLGYMNAGVHNPVGMPVPTPEDAPYVDSEADDAKGYRVRKSEEFVFDNHPQATHFRYPYVYGPNQLAPRDWCVVRRVLDKRPHIILADGGLTLNHHGYTANLGHAVLLAVDQPETAAGQIYNVGDEETLTLRQMTEIIIAALESDMQVISMPWELAAPATPLVMQPWTTHRVFDLSKIKSELGYRDLVGAREAVGLAARWLVDHPPPAGGTVERVLQDPFDYAAEDRLVDAWQSLKAAMPEVEFAQTPGYGASYSGPGGKPRTRPFD
ncbi:MAG: NAD-dependent dehydratase [Gammaproteobacteria bacterium]|nr:NAD-dependent dehydratase [Gammaproteobacteria bacterium]